MGFLQRVLSTLAGPPAPPLPDARLNAQYLERATTPTGRRIRPRVGYIVGTSRDDFAPELAKLGLTANKVADAFKAADWGETRQLQELFSKVEEDPHVHSVLSKRRRAVVARTLQINPPKQANGKTALAERAAHMCRAMMDGDADGDGLHDRNQALYDITDAIGRAYSLMQIEWFWNARRSWWMPVRLNHYPQRFTRLGDWMAFKERDRMDADEVRILTEAEPIRGEPLEPYQWIVHKHKARSDVLARAALLRIVTWWMCFKHWSAKDWSIFGERYGMPLRLGKYPAGGLDANIDEGERAVLEEAVLQLGKDAGAIIPEGCSIEFVETKHSGSGPYGDHAAFCNGEISKAILGNTLTTEVGSTGGNRALGEVHERAEDDMTDQDALLLAGTLRQQLFAPFCLFNLGEQAPVPEVAFLTEEERAQKELAERDQILVRGIGLPIPKRYFYETYEVPEPEEGEEVVEPPRQKLTAEEDLPEEEQAQADALDEEAEQAELPNADRAIVRAAFRGCGLVEARRTLRALADVKKKSRAWARSTA